MTCAASTFEAAGLCGSRPAGGVVLWASVTIPKAAHMRKMTLNMTLCGANTAPADEGAFECSSTGSWTEDQRPETRDRIPTATTVGTGSRPCFVELDAGAVDGHRRRPIAADGNQDVGSCAYREPRGARPTSRPRPIVPISSSVARSSAVSSGSPPAVRSRHDALDVRIRDAGSSSGASAPPIRTQIGTTRRCASATARGAADSVVPADVPGHGVAQRIGRRIAHERDEHVRARCPSLLGIESFAQFRRPLGGWSGGIRASLPQSQVRPSGGHAYT